MYMYYCSTSGNVLLVFVSEPVIVRISRLLFYLEAVRLPPVLLPHKRFTADFDSDEDFVRFPPDSIFSGSITDLDVSQRELCTV